MAASKKDNVNAGRVEYLGDDREGKLAALNNAVAAIEKNYGKGSIMKLGDSGANIDIEAIPTGSISLDVALGVGGVPRGRIIEIYGPESSGKTTVALHMIAEAQKRNGIAGFIDAEHALDPQYAKKIGVDIDNLYISQPDNGEQALEIAETMSSGALDIVIVDSVAALVPKAEIEGDMDDQQVGLHARPATFFIQKANEYKSSIWVEKEERRVNAKSLLGVLSLGIVGGTTIRIIADGADEEQAVEGLVSLVQSGFAE